MRDLYVEEALERLALEAAELLSDRVAEGEELPYEVAEQPGERSSLYRYAPLTHRFIHEHASELRRLPSFEAACTALAATQVAAPYLEQAGAKVPVDPRRRAEQTLYMLLCRIWEDCADFNLDGDRFEAAVGELWACADDGHQAVEVIVPVIGLQLPLSRLELTEATLVRADSVDVPAEAKHSEGMGRAEWEPQFLAVSEIARDEETHAGAKLGFRRLISTLRLFKAGGVGLGPHAWARTGERWRRISTGMGRPRAGGWQVSEEEAAELIAFDQALAGRGGRGRPLAWAISRFEMGSERQSVLEGLSDYLLSLRGLLEGGGPAEVGLSMRVAALCAEPDDRLQLKGTFDRAQALERGLMSGSYPAELVESPLELASIVEDHLRAILRDAACGHLGADLRATADEILLADGVSAGDGGPAQRGGTSEWMESEAEVEQASGEGWIVEPDRAVMKEVDAATAKDAPEPAFGPPEATASGWAEPEPEESEEEMRVYRETAENPDWMEQIEEIDRSTLDFPAVSPPAPNESRPEAGERVRHLFPVPDTTEWSVRELDYDRDRFDTSG